MNQSDKNLLLERHVYGRENSLIESYISIGPSEMKEEIGLSDKEWRSIFDYLVFENNLLHKVINENLEFFLDNYIKYGASHVRDIFDINEDRYDMIWSISFDFIAIAHEGLLYHVMQHRDRYVNTLKVRGSDFVRKVLGIWGEKYDEHWGKVLDLLLNATCEDMCAERNFEHGLQAFSYHMNGHRIHRPLVKSDILKRGLV